MPKAPPRIHEWKYEYTLLCERCGYILEDLDQSLPCPECGKPIAESLPRTREGSPWQKSRSLGTMIRTWFHIMIHPKKLFNHLDVQQDNARSLMCWANLLAAMTPTIVITLMVIPTLFQENFYVNNIFVPIVCVIFSFTYWAVALAYTALAVPRIRALARFRNQRLTDQAIWTLAGHASTALTIAPLLIAFVITLQISAEILQFSKDSMLGEALLILIRVLTLAALPIAVIVFEILLSIGTRKLRNRNSIRVNLLPTQEQLDA